MIVQPRRTALTLTAAIWVAIAGVQLPPRRPAATRHRRRGARWHQHPALRGARIAAAATATSATVATITAMAVQW